MSVFDLVGAITNKQVKRFLEFLENPPSSLPPITINLVSHGGEEAAGRALAGLIRRVIANGTPVTVNGFGNIESAAVIVFAAGSIRRLSHAATIMVHESSVDAANHNASGFKKLSKQMESDEIFWCSLLQEYTGTDAKVWAKLHNDETFLRPDECLKLNLATEII